MPDAILNKYENEFGSSVNLKNVKYGSDGSRKYVYGLGHPLLRQFRNYIKDWLKQNDFPIVYTTLTYKIRLTCFEELSDSQIHDFEEEFEAKCSGYSVSCGSDNIEYEFV